MSVVDSILLVVPASLLLIEFCWLLRHVCCWLGAVSCCGISHSPQSRNGRAQSHTSGPSNGRPFPLKRLTAVPHNGIGTIHHSDRQPVCYVVSVGYCNMSGISAVCYGISIVDLFLFVVATYLLLIGFCSLLRHVCC
jgi:hypothetical protein